MSDEILNGLLLWKGISFEYTKVVIASLLLPLLFFRQFIGIDQNSNLFDYLNGFLKLSWLFLGIAILFGFSHQIWITDMIEEWYKKNDIYDDRIHWLFRGFIFTTVIGISLFAIGCYQSIRHSNIADKQSNQDK